MTFTESIHWRSLDSINIIIIIKTFLQTIALQASAYMLLLEGLLGKKLRKKVMYKEKEIKVLYKRRRRTYSQEFFWF